MDARTETLSSTQLDLLVDDAPLSLAEAFAWARERESESRAVALRLFRPRPAVSVGRDQAIAREVRLPWCRDHGVPVLRRPTGGGALWLDPGQWALLLAAPAARLGADPAARLSTGGAILADALRRLGVETVFVPPNDVEVVGGAKIGSVFLAEEGDRALLFATLLVEFDVAAALSALLVPTEKLTVTGLEHARERIAPLADLVKPRPDDADVVAALVAAVGERLGTPLHRVPPATARAVVEPIREADVWETPPADGFETMERTARATLRLRLERASDGTVATAAFATDAAFVPADLAARVAAALAGASLPGLPEAMARARRAGDVFVGFAWTDLLRLAVRAAEKARLAAAVGLDGPATTGLMLAGPGDDSLSALDSAGVVLVPYCAKPAWCALRPTPDCIDCGSCAVGDAYALARDRGLEVTTILNFEHLSETLADMRARGVSAYVGMCCSDFFLKRHAAFREAGMDAVLMDVVGATCYDLKEEHLAYAGAFRAEAELDLDALEKVMTRVPARRREEP